jgi:hypothetical protein
MDVDLTSLVDEGDTGNLAFEGSLWITALALLDCVGLVIVTIGELSFLGDSGATGSSETGSVTSDGLDMEVSVSCRYSWADTDVVSFGRRGKGDRTFLRIVCWRADGALCRAMIY